MQSHRPCQVRISLLLCGCCLAALAGCGDGRIATYPVVGTVLVDGKPAEGVMVVFCPSSGSEETMRLRPWATTDESGGFELATFVRGDGAPVGEYKVTARWPKEPASRRGASQHDPDDERAGQIMRDALMGRYATPSRTDLTAVVTSGRNELAPFELEIPEPRRGR